MRKRTGFTLIELLVVIAIIAILAAILFPVFSRVRNSAKKAPCMSNLKQIALAVLQYADDHDGYGPSRIDSDRRYQWSELLGAYGAPWPNKAGGLNALWTCESSPRTSYYSLQSRRAGGYRSGSHINWDLTKCPWPADTVMVSECGIEFHPAAPSLYCNYLSILNPKGDWSAWVYYPIGPAHGDGNNQAFFDGHVKHVSRGWITTNYLTHFLWWERP